MPVSNKESIRTHAVTAPNFQNTVVVAQMQPPVGRIPDSTRWDGSIRSNVSPPIYFKVNNTRLPYSEKADASPAPSLVTNGSP